MTEKPPTPPVSQEHEEIPLPPAPKLPFTLKANLGEYRRRLGVFRIILAIALSLLIWARGGFVAWLISVAIIIIVIVLTLTFLRSRKLLVTDEGFTFKTAFGRTKTLAWSDVSEVYIFANYIDSGFGITPRIIIADQHDRGFVSLTSLYWSVDDLNLLLAIFKKRKTKTRMYVEGVQSAAIAKTFPKLLPGYERHPYWFAFGIAIALIAAIAVFVLLTR